MHPGYGAPGTMFPGYDAPGTMYSGYGAPDTMYPGHGNPDNPDAQDVSKGHQAGPSLDHNGTLAKTLIDDVCTEPLRYKIRFEKYMPLTFQTYR